MYSDIKRVYAVIHSFWEYTKESERMDNPIVSSVKKLFDLNIDENQIEGILYMFKKELIGNIIGLGFEDESVGISIFKFIEDNKEAVFNRICKLSKETIFMEALKNNNYEIVFKKPEYYKFVDHKKLLDLIVLSAIDGGAIISHISGTVGTKGSLGVFHETNSGIVNLMDVDLKTAISLMEYVNSDLSARLPVDFDRTNKQTLKAITQLEVNSSNLNIVLIIESFPSEETIDITIEVVSIKKSFHKY